MVDTITYDEAEQIILATEPAAMSDKGDKIWTRRMAVALADVFNARLSSAALSGMAEPVAWRWEYLNSQLRGWESKITPYEPNASECIRGITPLYATPPASEREEIDRLKALLSRTQRHLKLFEGTSGYRDGEIQLLRDVSAALQTEGK